MSPSKPRTKCVPLLLSKKTEVPLWGHADEQKRGKWKFIPQEGISFFPHFFQNTLDNYKSHKKVVDIILPAPLGLA